MSHDILTLKDYLGIIRFSRAYGCFYLGMVLLSIGVIIMSVYLPHPHPLWFIVLEGLLTILFSLEIFLQIAVQRGMYFRSSMFNNIEFALCVASMVAYMEVIFQMNVQSYEWADILIMRRAVFNSLFGMSPLHNKFPLCQSRALHPTLRHTARTGRVLFFMRQHSRYRMSTFGLTLHSGHFKRSSDCSDPGDPICLEMDECMEGAGSQGDVLFTPEAKRREQVADELGCSFSDGEGLWL
eukprot:GGOE01045594.1.p1 GENE.GGOE01045594.1~~GGOE01045594.1.p1  ORF type:complete len:239 (-),score=39.09 GGOE01045594.1:180-896(-)